MTRQQRGLEDHHMAAPDRLMTAGIPDPHQPAVWLVRPWPVDADFGNLVRHFASAYLGWADTGDTARHVAYYEGYHAALTAAPFDEPIDAVAAQWREDMVKCIARCV